MLVFINKYLRLIRVSGWSPFIGGYLIALFIGMNPSTDLLKALFGFFSIIFGTALGYSLNSYSDRDIDKFQKPKEIDLREQPMATGEISVHSWYVFSTLLFILMVIFALMVSKLFAGLILMMEFFGGILYSTLYFKGRPVWDIICIPIASFVFSFMSGYLVAQGILPPVLPLIMGCILATIVYIPTVIWDYETDKRSGVRTSAVVFGIERMEKFKEFLYFPFLVSAGWILLNYDLGFQLYTGLGIVMLCLVHLNVHVKTQAKILALSLLIFLIYGVNKLL